MTNVELAQKLYTFAAHLQNQPEAEIGPMYLTNQYGTTAEQFKNIARVMPKPLHKRISTCDAETLYVEGPDGPFSLRFNVERKKVCRLVRPAQEAVYECEPLLSEDEENALV